MLSEHFAFVSNIRCFTLYYMPGLCDKKLNMSNTVSKAERGIFLLYRLYILVNSLQQNRHIAIDQLHHIYRSYMAQV